MKQFFFDADETIIPERTRIVLNDWFASQGLPTMHENHPVSYTRLEGIFEPYFDDAAKTKVDEFLDHFFSFNTYETVNPIEGAIEGLREIHEEGRGDVLIATSCTHDLYPHRAHEYGLEYSDKIWWFGKHAPFINPKNIIAISRKDLLCGDSLTDDRLTSLTGPNIRHKILFPSELNKKIETTILSDANIIRANDWKHVVEIHKGI